MIKILTKSSKNTKKAKVVDEKEREKEEQTKRYLEMEQRIKQAEEKRIQSVHLRGPENQTDPETPSELMPNQDKISTSSIISPKFGNRHPATATAA